MLVPHNAEILIKLVINLEKSVCISRAGSSALRKPWHFPYGSELPAQYSSVPVNMQVFLYPTPLKSVGVQYATNPILWALESAENHL